MFCPSRGAKEKVSANGQIPVWRGVYIHYFKINPPHFLLPCLFWKLSQPLGQDKKNSKQTYCRLLIIIFLWTPQGFSLRVFLEFSPKFVYSTMVAEKLQVYSAKITANTFANQKIESVHFYSCPQAKLSPRFLSLSPGRGELRILPGQRFLKIFFPDQKERGKDYGWKNYQNQQWYWSQVLINSTIFATFSLCEGSLI